MCHHGDHQDQDVPLKLTKGQEDVGEATKRPTATVKDLPDMFVRTCHYSAHVWAVGKRGKTEAISYTKYNI